MSTAAELEALRREDLWLRFNADKSIERSDDAGQTWVAEFNAAPSQAQRPPAQ
jgi:hypothetical protein